MKLPDYIEILGSIGEHIAKVRFGKNYKRYHKYKVLEIVPILKLERVK